MHLLFLIAAMTFYHETKAVVDNQQIAILMNKSNQETHIRIEPLTLEKIPAVKKTLLAIWNEVLGLSLTMEDKIVQQEFAQDFDTSNEHPLTQHELFLLLVDGDEVVGAGAVKKIDQDTCELKRMWILKSYRNAGWGKKIADQLIQYAREHRFKKMRLDIYAPDKQTAAIAFYRKLGFYEVPPYTSKARFCMEKVLQ